MERSSVLLLEDESLIGLDPGEILVHPGDRVIEPADTVEGAFFLLNLNKLKAAIVDILLNDNASTEVVRQLRQREVPFLVHSGDPQDSVAGLDVGDVPCVTKPAAPAKLLEVLARCEAENVS